MCACIVGQLYCSIYLGLFVVYLIGSTAAGFAIVHRHEKPWIRLAQILQGLARSRTRRHGAKLGHRHLAGPEAPKRQPGRGGNRKRGVEARERDTLVGGFVTGVALEVDLPIVEAQVELAAVSVPEQAPPGPASVQ